MTDLTQPASAAEFIAAGANPVDAEALAAQANVMAGRNGTEARAGLTFELQSTPPPVVAPKATRAVDAMQSLRAHTEAQMSTALAATLSPPPNSFDYELPPITYHNITDEEVGNNLALQSSAHRFGVPALIFKSLAYDALGGAQRTKALSESDTRAVQTLLDDLKRHDPKLRDVFDTVAPRMQESTQELLVQWARGRAGGRR